MQNGEQVRFWKAIELTLVALFPNSHNFSGVPPLSGRPSGFRGVAPEVTSWRRRGVAGASGGGRGCRGGCGEAPWSLGPAVFQGRVGVVCAGGAGPAAWRWERGAGG